VTIGALLQTIHCRRQNDAIWLLSSLLNRTRSDLLLGAREELSGDFLRRWKRAWGRRLAGEPLQYIAGSAPFYGREFRVRSGVLIPRPETEVLVELCLNLVPPGQRRVLDIGTGSGAIAITLKLERPELAVTGSDISARALTVARENAKSLGAAVMFEKADLLPRKLAARGWDLIVSNPPYLDYAKDKISREVSEWEPRLALEPSARQNLVDLPERAAWCAERILIACRANPPRFTSLELSPRIATLLERRWRKQPAVSRIWREPDLAGRKRFLLVAWENGQV
jgi:release factor-specific protein-(glutamine-N5) methyltransferase